MTTQNAFAVICRTLERHLCFSTTAANWLRLLTEAVEGHAGHDVRAEAARNAFGLLRRGLLHREEQKTATGVFCPACYCHHEVFIWTVEKMAALRERLYPVGDPLLSKPITLPGESFSSSPVLHSLGEGGSSIPASSASSDPSVQRSNHQPSTLNHQLCTITASCRCNDDDTCCPDLHLTPADIELWTLPIQRLARALCQALNLNSQFSDLKLPQGRAWQIGSWSTDAVPVILTVQPDPPRLRNIILELTGKLGKCFILFGPTSRQLDANCIELLGRADSAFLPLDTNLTLTHNGSLHCTKTPGDLFAKFTPQPNDVDQSVAQQAFALVHQLDAESRMKAPSLLTVFRMYCIENLSAAQIAAKGQCGKTTVVGRLNLIRSRVGIDPEKLRAVSTHLHDLIDQTSLAGASNIHRKNLIDDSNPDPGQD